MNGENNISVEEAFKTWWEEAGTESIDETEIARSAYVEGASRERDACHDILSEHCFLGGDVGIALQHILARGEK